MKAIYKLIAFSFLLSFTPNLEAQVLDLESTTDGMLLPRMTTAQRNAITNLSESLLVYDTDTNSFWYYEGTTWNELGTGGGSSPTGFAGFSGAASPNISIPDNDPAGVTSAISMTAPGTINAETQIEICIDIVHPYIEDIAVSIIAPDGVTSLNLSSFNGVSGDNYTNTCFTTNASTLVTSGTPPYAGSFIPEQSLSGLIGQPITGDWTLMVGDYNGSDIGTFESWSIAFQRGIATTSNSSGGDNTFYYDFSSFSNSSCCNNMIYQQTNSISAAASIFENSTQPKHAYGKPLSFDVEIVSIKFLHRYDDFTPTGTESLTVQPAIADLDGTLDRYVTAAVDLRTAPHDTWIDLPLTSSVAADNLVDASALQYIVWQLNTAMSGTGNLDGIGILQVEVKIP